jgi:superfamily II DNA/RNA helicase
MLLFSATYPEDAETWIDDLLKNDHAIVTNERANSPNLRIIQSFEECPGNFKVSRLVSYCKELINDYQEKNGMFTLKSFYSPILGEGNLPRILIFVDECQKAVSYFCDF